MAKVLFIQKTGLAWHGIMSMSAVLKENGHETSLVLTDEHKHPFDEILRFQPDFVAFPIYTGEHDWVFSLSKKIKHSTGIKIILGGPHATFYPETVPSHVDYIVQGEGEQAILDIVNGKFTDKLYNPVLNLDELPMQDRELYYKYDHLAKANTKQFLTGRGCPFDCSFCCNHLYMRMYRENGFTKFIRRKSPETVIKEMAYVKSKWGFRTASFTDDVFTLDHKWLDKFLPLYKSEIGTPFACNTRHDLVTPELISSLKLAGCEMVEMGIESGNPELRQLVLHKSKTSNQDIIEAARIIRRFGLKLKTYNIIGLPGETLKKAMETVDLNAKCKPDFAACSFMIPFPKYDIAEHYNGVKIPDSIYEPLPGTDPELINLQSFFYLMTRYPWAKRAVVPFLRLPPNKLYRFMAMGVYGLFMSRAHGLKAGDLWRYARHIKNPFRI